MPSSSGSSQPRNQTGVSCIVGRFFTIREPLVRRQGSQVSMRVARGSASWLSSHGRTRAPPPAFPRNPRGRLGFPGPTQGEGPKHPVSCIEPGLATHFIHDILHVSMPFSQIFPPPVRGAGWEGSRGVGEKDERVRRGCRSPVFLGARSRARERWGGGVAECGWVLGWTQGWRK